jgi:hypothetical protein
MYNSNIPSTSELPSSSQLLVSTLFAAIIAALVLITAVLPAEYGIDPTGIGRTLGLTQMGEIKVSLAEEAAQPENKERIEPAPQPPVVKAAVETTAAINAEAKPDVPVKKPLKQDQRQITLKPGAAAEVKMAMRKGAKVIFSWSAEGGALNFDTHGDNVTTEYHGYGKGRNVSGDSGELIAAFDGNHGWFWRNRSGNTVTLTLTTEGEYQVIA